MRYVPVTGYVPFVSWRSRRCFRHGMEGPPGLSQPGGPSSVKTVLFPIGAAVVLPPSPEEFLCGTVPRYGNKFVSCGKFSRRMEFEGTVYKVLPVVKGTSQRGEWMKQEVVFELPGEFNRKICVGFWGDKAQEAGTLRPGDVHQCRIAGVQRPLVHRSARMEDDADDCAAPCSRSCRHAAFCGGRHALLRRAGR